MRKIIDLTELTGKKESNFAGPAITCAFMQAAGMVNDHMVDCPGHKEEEIVGKQKIR